MKKQYDLLIGENSGGGSFPRLSREVSHGQPESCLYIENEQPKSLVVRLWRLFIKSISVYPDPYPRYRKVPDRE